MSDTAQTVGGMPPPEVIERFQLLIEAGHRENGLGIIGAKDKNGKDVYLLCSAVDGERGLVMLPIAQFVTDQDLLDMPTPEGASTRLGMIHTEGGKATVQDVTPTGASN